MALKSKFCVKCGKETSTLIEGSCASCFLNEHKIRLPEKISLRVCPKCKAVYWLGQWISSEKTADYFFRKLLEEKVKVDPPIEVKEMTIDGESVGLVLKILSIETVIYYTVDFHVNKFCCPECSRQHNEWETKIQLRGLSERLVEEILRVLTKVEERIVKIEDVRNGLDVQIFSRKEGASLTAYLKKRYGFKVSKTYEQHGHDFDKNVARYREVVLMK